MSDLAVMTSGLTKRYRGDVLAVDRVDLRVARGEIYAFLGLNGAGKSTTIRMLLGMIRPTAGHAELFGERVQAGATHLWQRVGHLVESATAYPELTVRENLEVARRLAGVADGTVVGGMIDRLALEAYADRRAGTLSLGNLQRLALARALLHEPELLVLDEPANGLDPAGVIEIRELIRSLARERGVTVFMSSHILAEVDRLATRIGIVHRGRLIEELDSEALEAHRDRRLEIGARDLDAAERALRAAGLSPTRGASDGHAQTAWLELRDALALESPDDIARLLVDRRCAADAPRPCARIARGPLHPPHRQPERGGRMSALRAAMATEFLKARRSRVPWGVAAGFSLAPLVMGLFMVILKDPEGARALGLLGAKAQLTAGSADWPTFLNMLGQAVAIGGAILFAFLTAWVFGREFADRTVRGLLANPTSRRTTVVAKALVIAAWGIAISAWVLVLGLGIGAVVGLPEWSPTDAGGTIEAVAFAAILTIGLQTWAAFFAGVGRGYIAPLAWTVAMIALSQIVTVLGWGSWFPWSVPAILAGAGGTAVEPVTVGGVSVVLAFILAGLAATIVWWERADQTG